VVSYFSIFFRGATFQYVWRILIPRSTIKSYWTPLNPSIYCKSLTFHGPISTFSSTLDSSKEATSRKTSARQRLRRMLKAVEKRLLRKLRCGPKLRVTFFLLVSCCQLGFQAQKSIPIPLGKLGPQKGHLAPLGSKGGVVSRPWGLNMWAFLPADS
jgi:hypothetical protein